MGLAEPRKRLKISHDPNNLAWSQAENSYGQRLLLSQGWKAGQGLGARSSQSIATQKPAKVQSTYKDDLLGLGAVLKSNDVRHSRTGLDAFQGLLGRLNGKNDGELQAEQQKADSRGLAIWAQGRFGGMTFVPGGLLIQGKGYTDGEQAEEAHEAIPEGTERPEIASEVIKADVRGGTLKEERKQRKEERKARKDALAVLEEFPRSMASTGATTDIVPGSAKQKHAGSQETTLAGEPPGQEKKKKKRRKALVEEHPGTPLEETDQTSKTAIGGAQNPSKPHDSRPVPRSGRHVLRGRNIEAKRMAFADAKMLDEIFMGNA